jgi:hypothetical protein
VTLQLVIWPRGSDERPSMASPELKKEVISETLMSGPNFLAISRKQTSGPDARVRAGAEGPPLPSPSGGAIPGSSLGSRSRRLPFAASAAFESTPELPQPPRPSERMVAAARRSAGRGLVMVMFPLAESTAGRA